MQQATEVTCKDLFCLFPGTGYNSPNRDFPRRKWSPILSICSRFKVTTISPSLYTAFLGKSTYMTYGRHRQVWVMDLKNKQRFQGGHNTCWLGAGLLCSCVTSTLLVRMSTFLEARSKQYPSHRIRLGLMEQSPWCLAHADT